MTRSRLSPSSRKRYCATTTVGITHLSDPVALRDYEKFLPPFSMLAAKLSGPPGGGAVWASRCFKKRAPGQAAGPPGAFHRAFLIKAERTSFATISAWLALLSRDKAIPVPYYKLLLLNDFLAASQLR